MAYRKNVKRIDPRYFLNETVNRLDEREGETAEDVAVRLKSFPASFRASAVNDFVNMRDGSTEMGRHYPHVQDLVAFASDVLELLGDKALEGEEELEEGWKEFAQGADDFMGDLMLGKPRGYSKDARQKRARMDADDAALNQRIADRAARKKEKAASDRERAQDRAKRRKAQDIRNRQLDKWEAGQKEKERAERDRKSRERHRDFDGGIGSGKMNWREE